MEPGIVQKADRREEMCLFAAVGRWTLGQRPRPIAIEVEDLTLDTAGEFVDQIEGAVRGYDLDEPISEFADFLKQCIIFTVGKRKSFVGISYSLVGEVDVEENDN